jgi:alginate O-acetyltransferase complex protein AlgJ
MPTAVSLQHRYTQLFVLFILCSLVHMLVQSIGFGLKRFEDNLYKKSYLIEKANLVRIQMGDRVFPAALLGKDGWMEYTGADNLDDFQNFKALKHKKSLAGRIAALEQYLKSQGATLLIVVVPNKASIYPDKLPEQIRSLPTQTRLDTLISYLETNNIWVMADLRPELRAARQHQDVYYRTNTHWNGYGAFVAYTTIINILAGSHPELRPYESKNMELVTEDANVNDIPRSIHANFITEPGFFFAPRNPFVQTLHPGDFLGYNQFSSVQDDELPTLLMFHDSFGLKYLNNYLSMNFRMSHFIHLFSASQYLTKESILQFTPDVVIIEIVEGNLDELENHLLNFESEQGF